MVWTWAVAMFSKHLGAAHCQIMDALYPGVVPLHKVKFNATEEYEMVSNFKILQECFHKVGVEKVCEHILSISLRPLLVDSSKWSHESKIPREFRVLRVDEESLRQEFQPRSVLRPCFPQERLLQWYSLYSTYPCQEENNSNQREKDAKKVPGS